MSLSRWETWYAAQAAPPVKIGKLTLGTKLHIRVPPVKRSPKSVIKVTRKDNTVLQESTAAATLVSAIIEADPLKVRDLGLICCKVPLVSTSKDKKYSDTQVEVSPGLYVITHSNNKMKKDYLEQISNALRLGWKIELIK